MAVQNQQKFAVLPAYASLTDSYSELLKSRGILVISDRPAPSALQIGYEVVSLFDAELGKAGWILPTEDQWQLASSRYPDRTINPNELINGLFLTDEAVAHGCVPAAVAELERSRTHDALPTVTPALAEAPHSTTGNAMSQQIIDGNQAIAIIGVGAVMPGANNAKDYWNNIVTATNSIIEVPADRWDPNLFWSADRAAPDKTYSKIGGFITDYSFDRKQFRLPPTVVAKTDIAQLTCLTAVQEALEDAGYAEKDFNRDRCATVLGNSLGGDLRDFTTMRVLYAEVEAKLRSRLLEASLGDLKPADIEDLVETISKSVKSDLAPISEDSMPGELPNVIAGRVASLFDLRGPNFVVDAACASSLAAIDTAIRGLRANQYDMCVCGGVDRAMGPPSYVKFSKIGALSPDGSRPFDANANGFVMGEGAGVMVLKRLSDAITDGDNIYAVIHGVGSSSDGKGKGITAPNPRGQTLAFRRAYEEAGYGPKSVSLFEAHGTSTPVGDPTEVGSMLDGLNLDDSPWATDHVGLGSVKSMIGHLKSAAGAASVIKIAMALKTKVLPPSLNMNELNPQIDFSGTPISVQTTTEAWETGGAPRRAGVSAFGFGGTNFHVAMEEYEPGAAPKKKTWNGADVEAEKAPQGGVLTFAADTFDGLAPQLEAFRADYAKQGESFAGKAGRQSLELLAQNNGTHRLSISFADTEELEVRLEKAAKALQKNKGWKVLANQGVFYSDTAQPGKLGMLFPGQGSQYLQMAKALAEQFEVVKATFDEADAVMQPIIGKPLSSVIFPNYDEVAEEDAFLALSQTEITQPAVLTVDIAILRLLQSFGLEPDMVAGHSLGEYGACVAAGVMNFADALRTVAARGTEMAKAAPKDGDNGLMVGVAAGVDQVEPVLAQIDGYVVCANKNCPTQTIIAGKTEPAQKAIEAFTNLGLDTVILPVSHAFHSEVVAAASEPLRKHLENMGINEPNTPILTNVTGDFYPYNVEEIRNLLSKQVAAPVEFIELIERMFDSGVRTFVEVGPKRAQTSFVKSILEGRPHNATHTNHPKRGDIGSLFDAIALLWANGAWNRTQEMTTTADDTVVELSEMPMAKSNAPSLDRASILAHMTQVLCEKTGYDADEIESDFELEADLGIDTVKQAEIMSAVREHYGFAKDDAFRLADYPTLDGLTDYVIEKLPSDVPAQAAPAPVPAAQPVVEPVVEAVPAATAGLDVEEVRAQIITVLCEQTGYDADEIEVDFELEADLGIDTVKQAEIMSAVREIYTLSKDESFRLADYPTLAHLADYVIERKGGEAPVAGAPVAVAEAPAPAPVVEAAPAPAPTASSASLDAAEVLVQMTQVLCEKTGYDADEIEPDFELEADLGIDTVKQAEIMSAVREIYGLAKDDAFRLADFPTLNALAQYVMDRAEGTTSQPAAAIETPAPAVAAPEQPEAPAKPAQPEQPKTIGRPMTANFGTPAVTGCALGIPGAATIFEEDAIDRILSGENMIGAIATTTKEKIVGKHITRLVKLQGGGGEMQEVTDVGEVVKLAGTPGEFDISEWDLPDRVTAALDETGQMAIAAGLMALKDAGLPLVPRYRTTRSGKQVTIGWQLPQDIADETAVIFASAFSGIDYVATEVRRAEEEEYNFDHRFLLKSLGMANARFAELVGARGPNLRMNNACASTTAAIALAEDWIKLGRCKRAVILGADNASGEKLLEWVGSGFLATGAASTEANVEDAALPFDKRRDGMLIGMGAVALVIEAEGLAEARGMEPVADLLGTRFVNSALHPTRLDVDHIAGEVDAFVTGIEANHNVNRHEIAAETTFISHETYTPARGGSAAAEIESIRRTFGEAANKIVVANTKGFTGHAMGAGIEDVVAVAALNRQKLPPIANFKEPDPELGDLNLSQGGEQHLRYALRLAAGFGSQLALAMFRFRTDRLDRVVDQGRYDHWLRDVSGFDTPRLVVEHRTLRLRNDGAPAQVAPKVEPKKPATKPVAAKPAPAPAPVAAPAVQSDFSPRAVVARAGRAVRMDRDALVQQCSGKRIAIAAGPMLIVDMFRRALERCGAEVFVFKGERDPMDSDLGFCDFESVESTAAALGAAPYDGFINLLGFGRDGETIEDVERAAIRSYKFAKTVQPQINNGAFFISLTGMGGRLGLDRSEGPLLSCGAVGGLTKSLARESEEALVRHIDIPREALDKNAVLQALSELLIDDGSVEVGLVGGVRYTADTLAVSDLAGNQQSALPTEGDVILVTGGAKGITAEVVKDLCKTGARFALVGRTKLTLDADATIDFDAEKARIKEELKAAGERVTPMAVENKLKSLRSQFEIRENMKSMLSLGAQDVQYFDCDLTNTGSIADLVKAVRSALGPINGVIHGAGVEISRLLAEKSLAEFNLVFGSKATAAIALWNAVAADKPKFFVNFGSVAGRFGNLGQIDYSAANDVLNKLSARINATTETRAITIDWTAWDEVGMATNGSMKTILEARGVEMLPPALGAPMVGQLLEAGFIGEALVAGALGDMAKASVTRDSETEFIDRIVERSENSVVLEREFNLSLDRFMRDHIYEGNPVVPGVMGTEFMARAAKLLGADTTSAKDVKYSRAAKLHHGEPLMMRAIAERDGNDVITRVESHRVSKTGRELNETHYEARFTGTNPERVGTLLHLSHALAGPERQEIYERYFHTGVFQVLEAAPHVGEDFVVAMGRVPTRPLCDATPTENMLSLPTVREMAFQAAGLWGMYYQQRSFLPLGIGAYRQHGTVQPGSAICIRCHLRDDAQEGTIAFDVEALTPEGGLLLVLENVVLVAHRALLEDETFNTFPKCMHHRRQMSAQMARSVLEARRQSLEDILDPSERADYDRLISDRRRDEWVAARYALKSLVADQVRDGSGVHVPLSKIVVKKNEERAPSIVVDGVPFGGTVSVTHSHGIAVVTLSHDTLVYVGIDREKVEDRSDTFIRDYFTPAEMALAPQLTKSERASLLWCVKESVTKALRRGLNLSMSEIEVTSITIDEDIRCDVKLSGEAMSTFNAINGKSTEIVAKLESGFAEAMTTIKTVHEVAKDAGPRLSKNEVVAVLALLSEKGLIPQYDDHPLFEGLNNVSGNAR